ncbi:MAG: hypothetical protein IH588_19240 [Anaerolineales bacterium]|nr:hypothetical protein [Anaerolineales bacterium]
MMNYIWSSRRAESGRSFPLVVEAQVTEQPINCARQALVPLHASTTLPYGHDVSAKAGRG